MEAQGSDLSITLRRVPYALEAFVAAVRASDMPYQEFMLAGWKAT